MNIDYELLEEQRNHLLSILWHDNKDPLLKKNFRPELDSEIGWGIVHLLDHLLDENLKKDLDEDPVFEGHSKHMESVAEYSSKYKEKK